MKSVAQHLEECLSIAQPLTPFETDLRAALGCITLEDIRAQVDVPATDISTCDGYALNTQDIHSLPIKLPVLESISADTPIAPRLIQGACVRLASGSALPPGANLVVPASYTDLGEAFVTIHSLPANIEELQRTTIRRKASDMEVGAVICPEGTRITPRHLAVLAAGGRDRILVRPAPRVVVMSIGDELVPPGSPLAPGRTYDATSHSLTAAIEHLGASVSRVSCVTDDRTELRSMIEDQLVRADVIITTGGLSYAGGDSLRDVLTPLGQVRFDSIAMSPGSMVGVGTIGEGAMVFCLPGNPVAALVSFEVFVRPALRSIAGYTNLRPRVIKARACEDFTPVSSFDGLTEYMRVFVNGSPDRGYTFELVGGKDELNLSAFSQANALAVLPPQTLSVSAGDELECMIFPN